MFSNKISDGKNGMHTENETGAVQLGGLSRTSSTSN
jgi:hypothetical protein